MIGLDTTVLFAHEIEEMPGHESIRAAVSHLITVEGERFALAPQILQEFLHVSTDPRRFERPLAFDEALKRANFWWRAVETTHCFGDDRVTRRFIDWMRVHRLGRKRVLDTFLAALYHTRGVKRLATANDDDFAVFGVFTFEDWATRR